MSDPPPNQDPLDYQLLIRESLRGVVRQAIDIVARHGLPSDHFFSISFRTDANGVELPPNLLQQYPEQMTIVIQHQYWDLAVVGDCFTVALSFGGSQQKLTIPFDAITTFVDPGAEFALQLAAASPDQNAAAEAPLAIKDIKDQPSSSQVVSLEAYRQR